MHHDGTPTADQQPASGWTGWPPLDADPESVSVARRQGAQQEPGPCRPRQPEHAAIRPCEVGRRRRHHEAHGARQSGQEIAHLGADLIEPAGAPGVVDEDHHIRSAGHSRFEGGDCSCAGPVDDGCCGPASDTSVPAALVAVLEIAAAAVAVAPAAVVAVAAAAAVVVAAVVVVVVVAQSGERHHHRGPARPPKSRVDQS